METPQFPPISSRGFELWTLRREFEWTRLCRGLLNTVSKHNNASRSPALWTTLRWARNYLIGVSIGSGLRNKQKRDTDVHYSVLDSPLTDLRALVKQGEPRAKAKRLLRRRRVGGYAQRENSR